MSNCQIKLREAGLSYPRTCAVCGLHNPCKEGLEPKQRAERIAYLENRLKLAEPVVAALRFSLNDLQGWLDIEGVNEKYNTIATHTAVYDAKAALAAWDKGTN